MRNGRAHYVTACSTGDSLESWRGGRRDSGVLIDIETNAIIAEGFSMPHSPRVKSEMIYLLDSGRGMLARIGETTFTTTSGTTGTAATVTFAVDPNGFAVQSTTTVNADGSTTIDNKAFNADQA